ncbi:MAG: hypothetical protein ACHREM_29790 [Polyangiales bacterium]
MAVLKSLRAFAVLAMALAIPTIVLAAPPAKTKTKASEVPVGRAPRVSLRIEPSARLWTLTVTNDDDQPLRLVADARLLRLEVEPEQELEEVPPPSTTTMKKKATAAPKVKHVVCELPSSMREATRTLTLAPGQRYIEGFDPRLYCLSETAALTRGVKLHASLGWKALGRGALGAPFVVGPASSSSDAPAIASAKEISAESITLDSDASATPSVSASSSTAAAPSSSVEVHGGPAGSVASADQVSFEIVVTDVAATSVTIYARPQLVGARVRTPTGSVVRCEHRLAPAPIVDFVTTLAPKERWTAAVVADSICPEHTFDRPGLYEVWPVLHAPAIPHRPAAVHGDLRATSPQWIRVETGTLPFHDQPAIAVSARASD